MNEMLQNYHKMSKKNVNQTEKFKDLENYQTLNFLWVHMCLEFSQIGFKFRLETPSDTGFWIKLS